MVRTSRFPFLVCRVVVAALMQALSRELYFIEKYATNNATVNVNLLLVKTMVETKDDGMQAECQTPSEWTPTPGTSVVDGQ